tara:strand:+ start:949 stop:1110 length:162 start_codon:yes stop_codon:yes gene_type:complete
VKNTEEFKKLIDKLFKSKIEASLELCVSRQTINNWYNGTHEVPTIIIKYLKKL